MSKCCCDKSCKDTSKLTFDVFCAWGFASDVGINVLNKNGDIESVFDLTSEEAKHIAHKLIVAAEQAEEQERQLNQYMDDKVNI